MDGGVKRCFYCRHFNDMGYSCHAPQNKRPAPGIEALGPISREIREWDYYILGETENVLTFRDAVACRKDEKACGHDARWFESAPVKADAWNPPQSYFETDSSDDACAPWIDRVARGEGCA